MLSEAGLAPFNHEGAISDVATSDGVAQELTSLKALGSSSGVSVPVEKLVHLWRRNLTSSSKASIFR